MESRQQRQKPKTSRKRTNSRFGHQAELNAATIAKMTELVEELKVRPGDLSYFVQNSLDVLHHYLNDLSTLEDIVTMIIDQGISNKGQFAYIIANYCNKLVGVDIAGTNFRNLLLEECRIRHISVISGIKQGDQVHEHALKDIYGLTHFIAELYSCLRLENNGIYEPYIVLGLATAELLYYLAQTKTNDDIKFVVDILKLVGGLFDHPPDERVANNKNNRSPSKALKENKLKQSLNNILRELEIGKLAKDVSKESMDLVDHVVELRARKWDWVPEHEFYGRSNRSVTPKEENKFAIYELPLEYELDDDWTPPDSPDDDENSVYLDDEPGDVLKHYEEFLKTTIKEGGGRGQTTK